MYEDIIDVIGVITVLIGILTGIIFSLIYMIKYKEKEEEFIKKLDDHEKGIILEYKNIRAFKKKGKNEQ